jgi:predicted lipoprotein with Yx(FWY)xxD motif
MKKPHMLSAGGLVAALAVAATAHAQPSASSAASKTVTIRHTNLGNILATSSGFTLYEFTRDRPNTDACQDINGCISFWPPLVGTPRAGHGVNARLLGTIGLKNGSHQVTYAGHPLYLYAGDTGPGQTGYVGVNASGGIWYAINAQGKVVR